MCLGVHAACVCVCVWWWGAWCVDVSMLCVWVAWSAINMNNIITIIKGLTNAYILLKMSKKMMNIDDALGDGGGRGRGQGTLVLRVAGI